MTTRKQERLVRYVSPFGSPAWMTKDKALKLLHEHDRRWLFYQATGLLSEAQRQTGPPRIEHAS